MPRDLNTYHEFDDDGKHYRLVYDEDYQPESSGDPEFGEKDLAEEIEKSGWCSGVS